MIRSPLLALVLCAAPAWADETASFHAGYAHWAYDLEGLVENRGNRVAVPEDIEVDTRRRSTLALRWDTGRGFWPDLAASWFHLDAGGQREVDTTGSIGPIPIPGGTQLILADADVRDMDLSLRYPVLRSALRVWAGLTLKRLDGEVTTRNEEDTESTTDTVDELFPLAHGLAEWRATESLALSLGGNWIRRGDDQASELALSARWRVWGALSLDLGWQRKAYRLDADAYRIDATLDGALVGASLVFD